MKQVFFRSKPLVSSVQRRRPLLDKQGGTSQFSRSLRQKQNQQTLHVDLISLKMDLISGDSAPWWRVGEGLQLVSVVAQRGPAGLTLTSHVC